MTGNTQSVKKIEDEGQRAALSSPLRIEIMGLFVGSDPLAISDMADLMNRPAGSLYHHVRILEQAGILQKTGTRPKGKRHEALYLPTASRFEYDTSSRDEDTITSTVKVLAAGFRMAERDLEAALRSGKHSMEDPELGFFATRLHMRTSPQVLVQINQHLNAVMALMTPNEKTSSNFGPEDRYVSLTLALLPIKGRDLREH